MSNMKTSISLLCPLRSSKTENCDCAAAAQSVGPLYTCLFKVNKQTGKINRKYPRRKKSKKQGKKSIQGRNAVLVDLATRKQGEERNGLLPCNVSSTWAQGRSRKKTGR